MLSRILLLFFILMSSVSFAEKTTDTLIVDVSAMEPCVIIKGEEVSGFEIDIINLFAQKINKQVEFRVREFSEIFDGIKKEEADFAIGGISSTAERESFVDFSQPILVTGKQILVKPQGKTSAKIKGIILNTNIPFIIFILFSFIIVMSHIIWIAERSNEDSKISKKYLKGVFDSIYFVVTTMATVGYGDIVAQKALGRFVVMAVMFTGIALFTWGISEFQAELVSQKISYGIESKDDLKNKKVAVLSGSTSEHALDGTGASIVKNENIQLSMLLLLMDEVDAVVSDSVVLKYMEQKAGEKKLNVVGEIFDKEFYSIAMSPNSRYQEELNVMILDMIDSSDDELSRQYKHLLSKWNLQ